MNSKKPVWYLIVPLVLAGAFSFSGLLKNNYWLTELPPFIFCVLSAILLVLALRRINSIVFGGIDVVFFLFFIFIILSSIIKAYPYSVTDRLDFIVGVLIMFMAFRLNIYKANIASILYALLLIALVHAVLGCAQFSTGHTVKGGFGNGAIFGCFMATGLVFAAYLILNNLLSQKLRIALIFVDVVIATALILSESRAACLAAIVGIAFIGFWRMKSWAFLKRRVIIVVAVATLLLTALLYFLWQLNTGSVSGRLLIWKIGSKMFLDNLVCGIGYGNFFTEYSNYQARYFISGWGTEQEVLTAGMNYHGFNEFLKIAIEGGIIGIVLFIYILLLSFKKGWRALRDGDARAVLSISLITTILVFGMFSYPLSDVFISTLYYFAIALIAVLPLGGKSYAMILPTGAKYVIIVLCSALGLRSMQKIYAFHTWHLAKETILLQEGDALEKYRLVLPLLSNNGAFLFNYGAELAELKEYKMSNQILLRASLYGNSIELYTIIADNYVLQGDLKQAEKFYTHAAYMVPKKFIPFNNLFDFYKLSGQVQKATVLSEILCEKPVKVSSVSVDKIKAEACSYFQKHKTIPGER